MTNAKKKNGKESIFVLFCDRMLLQKEHKDDDDDDAPLPH